MNDNIKDINEQLKEISKVIELLAISNEKRSILIETMLNDSKKMLEELQEIKTIVHTANNISRTMNILSINTQLECARLSKDGLALDYIAKEFKNLTDSNDKFAKSTEMHINDIINKISMLVSYISNSTASVQENSAALEEITASIFEISNSLDNEINAINGGKNNG